MPTPDPTGPAGAPGAAGPVSPTHIYVLLDRSGSMQAIADDVIGGFNSYLEAQQAEGDDAVITLVQFDDQDPFEVLVDAVPLREVLPLEAERYQPRGMTPLLDACGAVIGHAGRRAQLLAAAGAPEEAVVVVILTDGHENASREFSRTAWLELKRAREAQGWTFVYLGAGPDAFAEAGGMGFAETTTRDWDADAPGAHAAFSMLAEATSRKRRAVRSGRRDATEFFDDGDDATGRSGRRGA